MVWGMAMIIPVLKTAPQGVKKTGSILIGLILGASMVQGCSSGSSVKMAPPSNHELSSQAESRMSGVLVEAANATPRTGPPVQLLPEHGIRWSDVPRAMAKAATVMNMAVVRREQFGDNRELYELTSVPGWPSAVSVRRLDAPPWIDAEASVGPWPSQPAAQTRAEELRSSFLEWMTKFGAMKRVPPIR
jgi:hypothetical protein